jgi:hypothetical protein
LSFFSGGFVALFPASPSGLDASKVPSSERRRLLTFSAISIRPANLGDSPTQELSCSKKFLDQFSFPHNVMPRHAIPTQAKPIHPLKLRERDPPSPAFSLFTLRQEWHVGRFTPALAADTAPPPTCIVTRRLQSRNRTCLLPRLSTDLIDCGSWSHTVCGGVNLGPRVDRARRGKR